MVAKGLFVPVTNKKTGAVTKTPEQQGEDFKLWFSSEKYVKNHRGQYFERNCDNEDWENRLISCGSCRLRNRAWVQRTDSPEYRTSCPPPE